MGLAIVDVASLYFRQISVVEAVVHDEANVLPRMSVDHFVHNETDGGMCFFGSPKLRFFAPPDVNDTPFAISDTFSLITSRLGCVGKFFPERIAHFRLWQFKNIIGITPYSPAECSSSLVHTVPHQVDGFAPKLADIWVFL